MLVFLTHDFTQLNSPVVEHFRRISINNITTYYLRTLSNTDIDGEKRKRTNVWLC